MKFLSDEWFAKVDELRAAAGDLEIPDQAKEIVINVNITGDESREIHYKGGEFHKGHDGGAQATVSLTSELARKIFVENDQQAGMQAFMAGEIKIEGDMMKLMELQQVRPSDKQKELLRQIKEITE
jgi:putative sterol carrier protein